MPLDASSYIPRLCDEELKGLLARHPLVYISGGFGVGKSSLLERAQAQSRRAAARHEGGWHFFISRRLANMDGKPGAFTNNFLRMFKPAFGDVDSWATLQIRITAQTFRDPARRPG